MSILVTVETDETCTLCIVLGGALVAAPPKQTVKTKTRHAKNVIVFLADAAGKNPKGFFLMVEWDCCADKIEHGLGHAVNFDKLTRRIAAQVDLKETLLLFTADHSVGLRL